MAVFSGESWQKARGTLFTAVPPNPRSLALAKTKDGGPDEIELVKVHGEGRVELVQRSSPPFWITLSETTPQDLIMELGAPDSIYRKNDHRLSIHKNRRTSDASDLSPGALSPDEFESDRGSAVRSDEDDWEDDDEAVVEAQEREVAAAEHFYNYYHHGFDILISQPTQISAASPTARSAQADASAGELSTQPHNHLTATKIIFHGNIPGSYQFNRHRRSRWTLEHVPSGKDRQPLTSEMQFSDISNRLKKVFQAEYENEEQERLQQRGMALNRGWGDSPGSSCELLGGWEEASGPRGPKFALKGSIVEEGAKDVGNVELFGFRGMVFEVLKNGAVSALTVY